MVDDTLLTVIPPTPKFTKITDEAGVGFVPFPGELSPPQIATAYNIPASTGAGIKIGILSLGGGFLQSDLDDCFDDLKASGLIPSSINSPTINLIKLGASPGVFTGSGADQENTLDIYCVATMVPDATINFYVYDTAHNVFSINGYNSLFQQAISDKCDIITHSWAISELNGDVLGPSLQLASANNITVLNASGDSGSAFNSKEQVTYPASSPFVIAVGGTNLSLNSNNTRATEVYEDGGVTDPNFGSTWGSGGGFSTIFYAPAWQSGLQYQTYNNSTGVTGPAVNVVMRGVPDVAAPMNGYVMYFNGSPVFVGGTSAASPVMAGILARLKALTGISMSSPAWNTLFYANPGAFYDIITGNNATALPQGYAARIGWDPVTGLGSINGTAVQTILNTPTLPPDGTRPTSGQTYPRFVHNSRPSQGMMFPRPTIKL
jgi:kumamolisin